MNKGRREGELFNFWPAFTDGITGLFLVIIILFVVVAVQNFQNVIRLLELEQFVGAINEHVLKKFKGDPDARVIDGTIVLGDAVLFDLDSAELKPDGKTKLTRIGMKVKAVMDSLSGEKAPPLQVSIEGHTDSRGSTEHNIELSQHRAEAVAMHWERSTGLSRKDYDLVTIGRGPFRPVVAHATSETQHQLNRRIEIKIYPRFDALVRILIKGQSPKTGS